MVDDRQSSGTPGADGFAAFMQGAEFKAVAQRARKRRLTILVAGRADVGKSATLNSLLGHAVLPVGDYEPKVFEIPQYHVELEGIPLNIVLISRLDEFEGRDDVIIDMLVPIKEVDSLWYVTRLDDTRVRSDEKRAIRLLSQAVQNADQSKGSVWLSAIIVFTHAGKVSPDIYAESLSRRAELIRREIAIYAGPEIAETVRSVAVENCADTTPDGNPWRTALFTTAMLSLWRDDVAAGVIQPEDATPAGEQPDRLEVEDARISTAPASCPSRAQRWEELGRKIGGRFGASVGRVIGRIATWFIGN